MLKYILNNGLHLLHFNCLFLQIVHYFFYCCVLKKFSETTRENTLYKTLQLEKIRCMLAEPLFCNLTRNLHTNNFAKNLKKLKCANVNRNLSAVGLTIYPVAEGVAS